MAPTLYTVYRETGTCLARLYVRAKRSVVRQPCGADWAALTALHLDASDVGRVRIMAHASLVQSTWAVTMVVAASLVPVFFAAVVDVVVTFAAVLAVEGDAVQ